MRGREKMMATYGKLKQTAPAKCNNQLTNRIVANNHKATVSEAPLWPTGNIFWVIFYWFFYILTGLHLEKVKGHHIC